MRPSARRAPRCSPAAGRCTAPQRAAAATRVQAGLTELVRRLRPATMTAYVPVGSEPGGPDLPEVLRAALPAGAELLLPVLRDDLDLDWASYAGPGTLVAAGRGMREPDGPRRGRTAIVGATLVVVPALAVDRRGLRLGRGGGSYDRALARVPAATLTVALLHDGELLDRPARRAPRPAGRCGAHPVDGLRPLPVDPDDDRPTPAGRTRVR